MAATDEAIVRQNEEWAAQAKWEAEMDEKRAARLANRKPVTPVTLVTPVATGWGARGTRYDEECELCGREGEVDNRTGLCRSCSR
jgi:hypothetical protein